MSSWFTVRASGNIVVWFLGIMYRNHQGLLRPTDVKKARAVAQKAEEQRRMTIGRITCIK